MRSSLLVMAALVACSKPGVQPATDSPAAATPGTPDMSAPKRLTAADIAGSWTGVTHHGTTDSVVSRWTSRMVDSTTIVVEDQTMKSSDRYTVAYDADSMIATSTSPVSTGPGGPMVRLRAVGRLSDGKLTGFVTVTPPDRPDSVLARDHFVATKVP